MPTFNSDLRTFTGEIVETGIRKYAVFKGTWPWGNSAMRSTGSIQNALGWETGRQREESLKALAALEADHANL